MDKNESNIRSISRALSILRVINRAGSLRLTDIAALTEIPYPTTLRIVRVLVDEGVIEQEPTRKWYRPTALSRTLSYGFQNHDKLVTAARPYITDLTSVIHWPISIVTRVGNAMVVRASTSTITPMTFNHYYPGWQVPLIISASGRAFLAHSKPEVLQELAALYEMRGPQWEGPMIRAFTSGEDAKLIRAQGYAAVARTDYSANPGKTSSIAVPLFQQEELLGTLTMVFFASAMQLSDAIERFVEPMKNTSAQIGRAMSNPSGA